MSDSQKLNPVQAKHELVLWMVMGPILLIMLFLFGFAVLFFTPVFFIYSVISALLFFRTLNAGYLVKSLLFGFLSVFTLLLFFAGTSFFTLVVGVICILLLSWLVILVLEREFKWRNLHVFELAARPVETVEEGYSMRPMPAGSLSYNREQLRSFAEFIRRNLIAVVFYQDDKVVFGLERNRFKMATFNAEYIRDSWVSFDNEGNVSVHIARGDYEKFRESYAFDQLSDSLGSVFKEFLDLHRNGKGREIIRKLDFISIS